MTERYMVLISGGTSMVGGGSDDSCEIMKNRLLLLDCFLNNSNEILKYDFSDSCYIMML